MAQSSVGRTNYSANLLDNPGDQLGVTHPTIFYQVHQKAATDQSDLPNCRLNVYTHYTSSGAYLRHDQIIYSTR